MKIITIKTIAMFVLIACYLPVMANEAWLKSSKGVQYRVSGVDINAESLKIIEQWQQQTQQMFRELSKYNKNINEFSYEQLNYFAIPFGVVFSSRPESALDAGIKIVAVTPTSLMSQAGLQAGDIIVKIDDLSFEKIKGVDENGKWKGSTIFSDYLRSLVVGQDFQLSVLRDGKRLEIEHKVTGDFVPSFVLNVMENVLPKPFEGEQCALVKVPKVFSNKLTENLIYPIEMISINKQDVQEQSQYYLAKGQYIFEMREKITNRLKRSTDREYEFKKVTLDVECGKSYSLFAKFNEEQRSDQERYWEVGSKVKEMSY